MLNRKVILDAKAQPLLPASLSIGLFTLLSMTRKAGQRTLSAPHDKMLLHGLILVYHLRRQLMLKGEPPRFILPLWPVIDKLLRVIYHIKPLKADGSSIICLDLRHYNGPTRVLNDGSKVKTGDTIIELHLNNDWFKRRRKLDIKVSQSPREILGCFEQDLRFLAQQVVNGMFESVAALHGSTFFHTGAKRLGFQVEELPDSLWKKGARFYMAGLMQVYHLRGDKVSGLREKPLELKEVWLSRAALLTRYCPQQP
jgi:hypothetical protein